MSGTVFHNLSANGGAYNLAVSDDLKAFTITFSDVQLEIGNGPDSSTTTVAGRLLQVAATIEDAAAGTPITFAVSGYAFVAEGASAWLFVRTGGDTRIVDIPAGTDGDIVVPVTHTVTGSDSEVLVSVTVVAERSSVDAGAAVVSISAIDGGIPLASKQSEPATTAART